MKILFAALIIAAFGMNALAQDTDDIKAKAIVAAEISVTEEVDLDFRNVVQNVVKTVDTRNAVTAGTATGDETSGQFHVEKGAYTDVNVEFTTLPATLAGPGEATLPISFDNAVFGRLSLTVSNDGGVEFNPTSDIDTDNDGTTAPFFDTASFRVYLGGSVTPAETQAPGDYEADVTLTVSYN